MLLGCIVKLPNLYTVIVDFDDTDLTSDHRFGICYAEPEYSDANEPFITQDFAIAEQRRQELEKKGAGLKYYTVKLVPE